MHKSQQQSIQAAIMSIALVAFLLFVNIACYLAA